MIQTIEFMRIFALLVISGLISLLIIHQLKVSYHENISYWWILILIPLVWCGLLILFGILKIALFLLIPIGIGFGVYYFFIRKKRAEGEQTENRDPEEML